MEKQQCPYCLSEVNDKADVCKGCGRDVRKIFDLQTLLDQARLRIKELEEIAGCAEAAEEEVPKEEGQKLRQIDDGIKITAVFFIAALIVQLLCVVFTGESLVFWGMPVDGYLIVGIIAALMIYLVFKKGKLNIWHIVLLFFAEPIICYKIINNFYQNGLNSSLRAYGIRISIVNLISVLVLSLGFIAFVKRSDRYHVFSFKPVIERVYAPFDRLERVDKYLLVILSLLASIATIYKLFL